MAGGSTLGCDLGNPDVEPAEGPPLRLVAAYPADGAGAGCTPADGDQCGVARDTPIELRFDRFLLPKSAVRQSIRVRTGVREYFLQPTYDVVERVVIYRLAYGVLFEPGALHQVELLAPDDEPDGSGFRAFDGAPLVGGDVPLRFSFFTAGGNPPAAPDPPGDPSCSDALRVFADAGCTGCHTGADPPMGLVLDGAEGLLDTAVDHVAHEATTDTAAGRPLVDPANFGADMAIVDSGNPAASYLVYKLLAKAENFGGGESACRSSYAVALPEGECLPPSGAEVTRLRDAFVVLDPMPPGDRALAGGISDLRLLQEFIGSGADLAACR